MMTSRSSTHPSSFLSHVSLLFRARPEVQLDQAGHSQYHATECPVEAALSAEILLLLYFCPLLLQSAEHRCTGGWPFMSGRGTGYTCTTKQKIASKYGYLNPVCECLQNIAQNPGRRHLECSHNSVSCPSQLRPWLPLSW